MNARLWFCAAAFTFGLTLGSIQMGVQAMLQDHNKEAWDKATDGTASERE